MKPLNFEFLKINVLRRGNILVWQIVMIFGPLYIFKKIINSGSYNVNVFAFDCDEVVLKNPV